MNLDGCQGERLVQRFHEIMDFDRFREVPAEAYLQTLLDVAWDGQSLDTACPRGAR